MKKLEEKYDQLYSSHNKVFGNGKPDTTVVKLAEKMEAGKVLDVGGGQGRNALYLAQKKHGVTVVDISKVALEQIKEKAEANDLKIETIYGDISSINNVNDYNAVIFSFVLHHIHQSKAGTLLEKFKNEAPIGAFHAICAFTSEGDFYKNFKKERMFFYPKPGELKKMYSDWNIIFYEERESTTRAKNKEGKHMSNISTYLLAQKK